MFSLVSSHNRVIDKTISSVRVLRFLGTIGIRSKAEGNLRESDTWEMFRFSRWNKFTVKISDRFIVRFSRYTRLKVKNWQKKAFGRPKKSELKTAGMAYMPHGRASDALQNLLGRHLAKFRNGSLRGDQLSLRTYPLSTTGIDLFESETTRVIHSSIEHFKSFQNI